MMERLGLLNVKNLIVICLGFCACGGQNTRSAETKTSNVDSLIIGEYHWAKVLDSAEWDKSYNYQMLNIKDTLWVLHPYGNWYSVDGSKWHKSNLKNVINNHAFLDYVFFKDALYGLGSFEGNIEQFTFKKAIFRSTDLKTWTTLAKNSNLPDRFFYHPFVFDDKIWIIGGEDQMGQYADIWNSEDGILWIKQKDHLPFGKRRGTNILQLNGKIYMIGQDVWSSTDAINWQLETEEILPGEENFYPGTVVAYDDKIWLLGCNRNGKFKSQVFVSGDGKHWVGQEAPWSPRGGVAAAVFKNMIFMTGGKYGGLMVDGVTTEFIYSNDLWTLSKP